MVKYISEKAWEFYKRLMWFLMVVFPFLGLGIIWLRDWNTLKPSSIANVSVDTIGMLILIFLFGYTIKDQNDRSLRTGCFAVLVFLNSLQFMLDLCGWCVDGLPRLWMLNTLANTGFYFFGLVMIMVYWRYLLEMSETENLMFRKLTKLLHVGGILASASVFFNIYGKYYFYISVDGFYTRSNYYFLSNSFLVLMLISFSAFLSWLKIPRKRKLALTTFVVVPVIANAIQIVFYGTSLVYVGTLLSLFMIYGFVFTEQNQELAIQIWENTRKEQEIMLARQRQQILDADLNLAANIQRHVIPKEFPESEAFSMYAYMLPAREVGGDFYDFFLVDADHLALVIADVSGKGIPASLYMMTVKTMIKNAATQGMNPKALLEFVNRQLCENSDEVQMFVTVWIGILEVSTGKVLAANAGHEYPAICRKDGQFEIFKDRHGFVLGGMEGMRYKQYEFSLMPGDTMFLYTDGVTEATNASEELFGTYNMLNSLNKEPQLEPKELLKKMQNSLEEFVGDGDQFDDITMMAIKMSEPAMTVQTISVIPTEESMTTVQAMAEELMDEAMVPMKVAMKIGIAIDEIFSNIIQYSQATSAEVTCRASSEALEIIFLDDGVPYNPLESKDPDITLSAEERDMGGLGIFITKNIMDTIDYAYKDGRNQLRVMKKL